MSVQIPILIGGSGGGGGGAVSSVAGKTGAVTLVGTDLSWAVSPEIPRTNLGTNLASGTALAWNTHYRGTLSSNKTLTHTGTPGSGAKTSLDINVTTAATLTIPSSKRIGDADSAVTSIPLPVGRHILSWEYNGAEVILTDSASAIPVELIIAASDESTALTTGTNKVTFRMPFAMNLTGIRGSLGTAQTSGSVLTVDVNENGTTVLSTKLTFDNTEKTTTSAATPAVISDTALADDSEITLDIDQVGDGTAKGLKVTLLGTR